MIDLRPHIVSVQMIEQLQVDLNERSTFHVNINNQISQESKARMAKIAELEQASADDQQRVSSRKIVLFLRLFVACRRRISNGRFTIYKAS